MNRVRETLAQRAQRLADEELAIKQGLRPHSTKARLLQRQNWLCCWCGCVMSLGDVSIEHIIPWSLGGTHEFANLAVAHVGCNARRSSDMDVLPHGSAQFDFIRERILAFHAKRGTEPAKHIGATATCLKCEATFTISITTHWHSTVMGKIMVFAALCERCA